MSLRDEACFRDLAESVRDFARGDPLIEIVNSGNWGDALIHAGQREFLRDAGIRIIPIPVQKLKRTDGLLRRITTRLRHNYGARRAILTGCGAIPPYYKRSEEMASAAKRFSQVLLMPSPIPFLPDFPAGTRLWRRDHLESMEGAPDAPFCHDMAFYLRPSERVATKDAGIFFRVDAEKGDYALPEDSVDLSNEGTHLSDSDASLDRIGDYRVIHTNRLHVGIGGALLGREVHLYASRNIKLKSIFEASLKPFYPNVFHHENPEDVARLGASLP